MTKWLARIAQPIVEEAMKEIYARRWEEATTYGLKGADRRFFIFDWLAPQDPRPAFSASPDQPPTH
jgi:hypothetical protein